MKKLFDPHLELAKIRNRDQARAALLHLLQNDASGEKDQPLQQVTNSWILQQPDQAAATFAANEESAANTANAAGHELGQMNARHASTENDRRSDETHIYMGETFEIAGPDACRFGPNTSGCSKCSGAAGVKSEIPNFTTGQVQEPSQINCMRPANYTDMCCGAAVKADLNASRSKNGDPMTELRTFLSFVLDSSMSAHTFF